MLFAIFVMIMVIMVIVILMVLIPAIVQYPENNSSKTDSSSSSSSRGTVKRCLQTKAGLAIMSLCKHTLLARCTKHFRPRSKPW